MHSVNLYRTWRLSSALRSMRGGFCATAIGLGSAWLGPVAQVAADDIGDFDRARALYERNDYRGAAADFGNLVGTEPPRLQNPVLVAESRKYLAASLLFLGDESGARAAFKRLLKQDPDYAIDPLAFPRDVVQLFEELKNEVREQRERETAQKRARDAEAERIAAQIAEHDRAMLAQLRGLAEQSRQEQISSRIIATIPFGVGQLQNGHRGFGIALGVAEGIAAATSVVAYIKHQQLADDHPRTESLAAQTGERERFARITNVTSFSIFAGLALVGIIDAHVRFVGTRVTSRPRTLPPDIDRWLEERGLAISARGIHF